MPRTAEGTVAAPDLTIRIKKQKDGSAALSCTRRDGTTTWQRQLGKLGAFFPLHDLTHYAVETSLGLNGAFFGTVATGWDISDFGTPYPRGPIPSEAAQAELLIGVFDLERQSGQRLTAEEYNAQLHGAAEAIAARHNERKTEPSPVRTLTHDEIARIRAKRSEVFAQWEALAPGDTLELPFALVPR